MAQILILKGDKPNSDSEAYKTFQGLAQLGQDDYTLVEYRDVVFVFNNQKTAVYYFDADGNPRDLASFDLVYIRDFHGYEHERNCIALYLQHRQVSFINTDLANFQHISKLTQYAQFAFSGISIPDSLFVHHAHLVDQAEQHFSYPMIVKSIVAKSGEDNHLVRDRAQLEGLAANTQAKYIVQAFVPNESDYRFIVLGDTVSCVYRRTRQGTGEHRNNVSQGGDKEYIDPAAVPEQQKQLAIAAAQAVGREICGVDLMVNSQTGELIILEANFNFGIRAVEGVLSEELHGLADFLHQRATKS